MVYSNQQNNNGTGQPRSGGYDRPIASLAAEEGKEEFDPVSVGQKFVDTIGTRGFTTSQLRQILSSAAIVKNKIDRENASSDNLSTDIQNEIQYLKLKLVYQMGREPKLKDAFNGQKGINLPAIIQNIGNSKDKYNRFYRLLESIVAYRKFAGQDS